MAQLMPLPLIVSYFSKIRIGFAFLVLSYPGGPEKRAVKQACVFVLVKLLLLLLLLLLVLLLLHLFNGLFFRTTWVSQYQKGKTSLNLN